MGPTSSFQPLPLHPPTCALASLTAPTHPPTQAPHPPTHPPASPPTHPPTCALASLTALTAKSFICNIAGRTCQYSCCGWALAATDRMRLAVATCTHGPQRTWVVERCSKHLGCSERAGHSDAGRAITDQESTQDDSRTMAATRHASRHHLLPYQALASAGAPRSWGWPGIRLLITVHDMPQ